MERSSGEDQRRMRSKTLFAIAAAVLAAGVLVWTPLKRVIAETPPDAAGENATKMLAEGKHTFRFDTFGDEAFWGDGLKLHQAIEGARLGGVGPGVSPKTALAVGLKIDVDAVPQSLASDLKAGAVNLDDPDTTLALLKLNAVVGV